MKKILALAVLLSGISFASYAQDASTKEIKTDRISKRGDFKRERQHRNPEEIAKVNTERLDKELKFTSAQREEVYKLQLNKATKNKERFEARAEERKLEKQAMKLEKEKFQSILTPEQQKLMKEKFADGRRNKVHRNDGRLRHKMKMQRKEGVNKQEKEDLETESSKS